MVGAAEIFVSAAKKTLIFLARMKKIKKSRQEVTYSSNFPAFGVPGGFLRNLTASDYDSDGHFTHYCTISTENQLFR